MYNAKILKILYVVTILVFLCSFNEGCMILRKPKDHQKEYDKKEAKEKKNAVKGYKKGVKKYQKEIAGGEKEKGKDRKVYKRMKKNKKTAKRINNNKAPDPWIKRVFKKNRVQEPFYVIWKRRIDRWWKTKVKKDK